MSTRKYTSNIEDYLEVILHLEKENKVARIKDIAGRMNIQRGSVSAAMQNLKKKGLIEHEAYGFISLTTKGKKIAKEIFERHLLFKDFLKNILSLDEETAEDTACLMEHTVNEKVMKHLTDFIDYVRECPRTGQKWIEAFPECGLKKSRSSDGCIKCVEEISVS